MTTLTLELRQKRPERKQLGLQCRQLGESKWKSWLTRRKQISVTALPRKIDWHGEPDRVFPTTRISREEH